MAHQTSKNRWVNGKRTLKWFGNPSEFAGQHEMGTAVPLGELLVEEDGKKVESLPCHSGYEKDSAVELFIKCGVVNPPKRFTEDDAFEILVQALRRANDNRINDVTTEENHHLQPGLSPHQLILTTDNGYETQKWVIEAASILETG